MEKNPHPSIHRVKNHSIEGFLFLGTLLLLTLVIGFFVGRKAGANMAPRHSVPVYSSDVAEFRIAIIQAIEAKLNSKWHGAIIRRESAFLVFQERRALPRNEAEAFGNAIQSVLRGSFTESPPAPISNKVANSVATQTLDNSDFKALSEGEKIQFLQEIIERATDAAK